jgi:hypothetical protein
MTTKDLIKKVQKNGMDIASKGKEIANRGSEAVEKVYKTTVEILQQAKQDGPELITNLVKKGESEWEDARKILDKLFQDNKGKLMKLQKDVLKSLEELRERIAKELPIDLAILQDILKKVEDTIGKIDFPFIRPRLPVGPVLPIDKYDELTVKTILPKLSGLTRDQLTSVLKYEEKHQKRVSVIREINKLMK